MARGGAFGSLTASWSSSLQLAAERVLLAAATCTATSGSSGSTPGCRAPATQRQRVAGAACVRRPRPLSTRRTRVAAARRRRGRRRPWLASVALLSASMTSGLTWPARSTLPSDGWRPSRRRAGHRAVRTGRATGRRPGRPAWHAGRGSAASGRRSAAAGPPGPATGSRSPSPAGRASVVATRTR